jgi:opacity protein-like surface antigen
MTDLKSPIFDLVQFTTPIGLRLSAWYGEGGVRFIASPHSAVRPYGEATAGFARLSTGVTGLGGPADVITDTGLAVLNSTKPLLGAGAGVLLQGGPLSIDLGYRYNKILTGSSPLGVLNLGKDVSVNQLRVGVGVRF